MYLIVEGIDTSGKSTQIELLQKLYPDAIITKEPGGTPIGQKIRKMILHEGVNNHKSELFLFLADRAEHYKNIVEPNRDKIVISDRGFISGIAYALANHDYKKEFLLELNSFALDEKLPDIIILLRTNEKLLKDRMSSKKEDHIEKRGVEYLLNVQTLMIELLEDLDINYKIIDASKTIEEIQQEIIEYID
jgi:dTMP kinase